MHPTMHMVKQPSLNHTAFSATVHCLTGCAIGEVLGMIVGITLGWGNWETVVLSVGLAFVFGYSLTLLLLLRAKFAPARRRDWPWHPTRFPLRCWRSSTTLS